MNNVRIISTYYVYQYHYQIFILNISIFGYSAIFFRKFTNLKSHLGFFSTDLKKKNILLALSLIY